MRNAVAWLRGGMSPPYIMIGLERLTVTVAGKTVPVWHWEARVYSDEIRCMPCSLLMGQAVYFELY